MFDELYKVCEYNPSLVLLLEQHIYNVATRLTENGTTLYSGGSWSSETIEGGWYFKLNSDKEWHVVNINNFADVKCNTVVFSLSVFAIALSEFSSYLTKRLDSEPAVKDLFNKICELHEAAMNFSYKLESSEFYAICD